MNQPGILIVMMVCLLFVSNGEGQGFYYRFEGTVEEVPSDPASLAWNQGYYPSQPFGFTLRIDPAAAGVALGQDGEMEPVTGMSDPLWPGFYESAFFVEFVDGDRLLKPGGDEESRANYGGATTPIETVYLDPSDPSTAITVTNSPFGALILAGGPAGDLSEHWYFQVGRESDSLTSADPRNWLRGDELIVVNLLRVESGFAEIKAHVTLQEITMVPEPSQMALALCEFVAIGAVRYRLSLFNLPSR